MNRGFQAESYYDHACLVATESDILDLQYKEVTLCNAIKKKWYDLFLLSYTDGRAAGLYHSTHAMRVGRARHYHRHRGSIHPLSKFRSFWDVFILHVFVLHQLIVYINTTVLLRSVPVFACYIAMLLELVILIDIIINARTGFIDEFHRTVELDKRLVLLNYCSTKLFFHTASAIPLAFLLFLRYGHGIDCTLCKANYFTCMISFLTIINLFRVYELSSCWTRFRTKFTATVFIHLLRIGVNITLIAMQLVHFSDAISLIHLIEKETWSAPIYNNSFFSMLFDLIHINQTFIITDPPFINAHFWRIVIFIGQPRLGLLGYTQDSFALIYPHPLVRLIAYGVLFCVSCWLMLEIFYCLVRQTYCDDEVLKNERFLLKLVESRQLPEQYHSKMKSYIHFPATKNATIEIKNGLYKTLPKRLKQEIAWQSFSRSILRIPYFSDWPREIMEEIIFSIEEHIFLKNDVIVEAGVAGQGLVIVDAGLLAVYALHKEHPFHSMSSLFREVEHLIDGDYFGQLSLVTDRETSTATVVAITTCKVLLVEKVRFRLLMRNRPDLFHSLREELNNESSNFNNFNEDYTD